MKSADRIPPAPAGGLPAQTPSPASDPSPVTQSDRLRILVVDDEPTIRAVLNEVLRMDGHEPTVVASGEAALEAFRAQPFPFVITDNIMGRMSGLALLREIKAIAPSTLVVIMTSHASIEVATTALRDGAYDFLVKPFDDLFLISALVDRASERLDLQHRNDVLLRQHEMHITELQRLNQELRHMADKDWLTGLYTRRFLRIALDAEIARARRHERTFSVIILDIDHFKTYNDTHGHLAGDDVLSGVGATLTGCSRREDVCARYGGEEFMVLLPETDRAAARVQAERIRTLIAEQPFLGKETQPGGAVTASLGVATFAGDATAAEIMERADQALYRAKEAGRNRVED